MAFSKRKAVYIQLEEIFSAARYMVWRCHKTRWHILALLWIACNQIAAGKGGRTTPINVYASVCILFERALRGAKFNPKQIFTLWERGQRVKNVENVEAPEHCPCCGQALPEELRRPLATEEDIAEAFKGRIPTKFTTKEIFEGEKIHCK